MSAATAARPEAGQPASGRGELSRRSRLDAVVRQAAAAALWLSLLLVTYWWVADGGVQDLGGWAGGLTSLGRLAGLVAALLMLVQTLMMARLPVLEQAFGQDRLARQHRLIGFTSFNFLLAHIGLIVWGYAAGDLLATPGTAWSLVRDYPGMLLAAGGTACLVMVVVTSIRAARRRLRYESWHLLHLYAYLGVGLALPHQLWTGQSFIGSPVRTAFWWGLWITTAVAVLGWRVGKPAVTNLRHQLRVTSVVRETQDVVSVYVTGRRLDLLRAEAGQFLTWRFLGRAGWTRANPFSLSAAPDGSSLRITVKVAGDGSASLAVLRPGTRVLVEGPHGRLSPRARRSHKVALIGAGVGMAPLRALAEGLPYGPGEAVLLHRFTDEPLFRRELDLISAERGLQVVELGGRRRGPDSWLGPGAGPVDDGVALLRLVPDIAERDVFVCGPPAWTDAVERATSAAGVPADRLHIETFRW